jgi:hypothetical protein
MIKNTFYIVYNVIYQIVSFWFLLYLENYFNSQFIPDSLMWKNNKPRTDLAGAASIQTLLLITEASVLLIIIYFVNKLILSDTEKKVRRNAIANKTAKIEIISSLCFIAILIWGSYL